MKQSYSELLKDPRWQKKRLIILERDEWTCQLCGDESSELHVHHKKYVGKPWECPDKQLQTLCKTCHSIVSKSEIKNIVHVSKGFSYCTVVSEVKIISLVQLNDMDCFYSVLLSVNRDNDDIIDFASFITLSDLRNRGLKIVEDENKIIPKF